MNCSNYFQYGDVIKVDRGRYYHYGIYENDNKVYEYNKIYDSTEDCQPNLSKKYNIDIHITSIWDFAKGKDGKGDAVYRLVLPDRYSSNKSCKIISIKVWDREDEKAIKSIKETKELNNPFSFFASLFDESEDFSQLPDYHIYSPFETIQRAKERIGEEDYNLINNNCECYALFCKIGINKSTQTQSLKQLPNTLLKFILKNYDT